MTLRIFDSLGREVRVWHLGVQAAGLYTVRWDGHDTAAEPVASGVYFYRLAFHPLAADNAPRLLQGKMSLL